MIGKIPQNIRKLSENNQNILKKYKVNRKKLVNNFDESIKVGQKVLSEICLKNEIDIHSFFYKKKFSDIDNIKKGIIRDIVKFDPGLMIIRPEMLHVTNEICEFLKRHNFRIDFLIKKKISIEEYFNLYKKEIANNFQNFRFVLPSRTLAYTNGVSCIIVFTAIKKNKDLPLADLFSSKFKGREGVKAINTIRGGIIYKEALRLNFNKINSPIIKMAIDPFAIYENLIKKTDGNFYHLKTTPQFYMLMYTAQGIHCSTYEELSCDLASVFSSNQLLKLKLKLEK